MEAAWFAPSMNSIRVSSILIYCILAMLVAAGSLGAQDVIVIKIDGGKVTKRTGAIVDWQGSKITLENGGRSRTIDSSAVQQIKTQWPPELATARKLVKQKDFAAAIESFEKAKSSESRSWVKSIIAAESIQAFDSIENHARSVREFLRIYVADPQTRFFRRIPLAWSVGERNVPARADLQKWLTNDNPALRLIASSWLLGRGNDSDAIAALEQLTAQKDKRIAQLALAQLWRPRLVSATQNDVDRWQRQIEKIEPDLLAGPLVVLAQAQHRVGKKELAQINLMKVRILHNDKKTLAAYALYQCGNMMSESQQPDRAAAMWRELVNDFPSSQFAALAGNKM